MSNWYATWDYNKFSYNAYNELDKPWNCIKKGSIYTNPYTLNKYFSAKCLDPYTAYAFWYKKNQFSGPRQYINCYWLPYKDPLFHNQWGYVSPGSKCSKTGRRDGWNVSQGGFHFYE